MHDPDEATRALAEIEDRRDQVIRRAIIPTWYWWAIGVLLVVYSAAADSDQRILAGVGTAVFVIGMLAVSGRVVVDGLHCTKLPNQMLGRIEIPAILGFVAAATAISLLATYAFKAADIRYAATLGAVVFAVLMAVGGPWLMRVVRRVMLAKLASASP